jgi:hypothetical protein
MIGGQKKKPAHFPEKARRDWAPAQGGGGAPLAVRAGSNSRFPLLCLVLPLRPAALLVARSTSNGDQLGIL